MSTCIPPEIVASLKERARKGQISAEDITKMLPEEKTALRSILEEFVAEKYGVNLTAEQVKSIADKAKRIDTAQEKVGENLGDPAFYADNLEFLTAKMEMNNYLQSQNPASVLKVITGTIGRGTMLASVSSPVLNIGSNIEVGMTEALARRLASGQLKGADNALVMDYIRMANKLYQKTGYDISRMMSLDDAGSGGERVLGQTTHAQGPGIVRKYGRVVEDIVFKQLMGAPDVAFASAHFADSVNLNAMKMAKGDKVHAREFMVDAMRLSPKTPEGKLLKAQGVMDAMTATWTDKTWASNLGEGVRKLMNDLSGDAGVGDYIFPFIKTPSNVVATGMDYAGMGIPKAAVETYRAFKSGNLKSPEYTRSLARNLVRSGLGLVGAMIITSQLDEDDFMGVYDPQRAQIESLRNSNSNMFRVKGKWISTDWLGPLAIPVTAMMYAKKYGKAGKAEAAFQYGTGVVSAFENLPGIETLMQYVKDKVYKKEGMTLKEAASGTLDAVINSVSSRFIPRFIAEIARARDTVERKATGAVNQIKAKIPGLRETLPEKRNIFGEPIKTEPGLSVILFGSRVRTDQEDGVIKELSDVSRSLNKGITFTDWDKSSSKQLSQFKEKVGAEKYEEAKLKYGAQLKTDLYKLMDDKYWKLSDEDKLLKINALDSKAMEKVFKSYGFKYKRD